MTDELLLHYVWAASERLTERDATLVEMIRLGTAFAWNGEAYSSWRSALPQTPSASARTGRGLTGADLEQAVMSIALVAPNIVQVVH